MRGAAAMLQLPHRAARACLSWMMFVTSWTFMLIPDDARGRPNDQYGAQARFSSSAQDLRREREAQPHDRKNTIKCSVCFRVRVATLDYIRKYVRVLLRMIWILVSDSTKWLFYHMEEESSPTWFICHQTTLFPLYWSKHPMTLYQKLYWSSTSAQSLFFPAKLGLNPLRTWWSWRLCICLNKSRLVLTNSDFN